MTKIPIYKVRISTVLLIISVIAISCISNINFEIEEEEPQYVIYGEITDRQGPYSVEVYQTVPFQKSIGNLATTAVNDAQVTISDLSGRSEKLQLVSNGTYRTSPSGITGTLNQSYFLTVEIGDNIYQSGIQTINPVPEIDTITYEISYQKTVVGSIIADRPYLELSIDFYDKQETQDFYLWKWSAVSQIRTFPELYLTFQDGNPVVTPLPCSFDDCSCCDCWINKGTKNPLVPLSDQYVNGNLISNHKLFTIPIDAEYFDSELYVRVSQYSLNQDTYNFWKLIADQEATESTLFAVPSAQIESNIKNINNENELVWGIFSASSIAEKSIFINRNDLGIRVVSDSIRNDCTKLPGSTNQKPIFWEN